MANLYKNKVIYGGNTLIDLTSDTISEERVLSGTTFHLPSGEQVTTTNQTGIPSKSTATYYPNENDQTITSGQYLSGAQTIKGTKVTNLSASNVKYGVTINVGDMDDSDRVATATGTFTGDATAADSEILSGKTAYKQGSKLTGTMPNNGSVTGTISTKAQQYTVPAGYHDGSGKVGISSTEQAKIIASNIRQGVTILGVQGTMSGSEGVEAQTLEVTPYTTQKVYTPVAQDSTKQAYYSSVTVAAIAYSEADNDAGGITVTIGTVAPD